MGNSVFQQFCTSFFHNAKRKAFKKALSDIIKSSGEGSGVAILFYLLNHFSKILSSFGNVWSDICVVVAMKCDLETVLRKEALSVIFTSGKASLFDQRQLTLDESDYKVS